MATLKQVCEQGVEPDPDGGGPRIKRGVASDRRISIHDPDKRKRKRFNGYKRHIVKDLDMAGLRRLAQITVPFGR